MELHLHNWSYEEGNLVGAVFFLKLAATWHSHETHSFLPINNNFPYYRKTNPKTQVWEDAGIVFNVSGRNRWGFPISLWSSERLENTFYFIRKQVGGNTNLGLLCSLSCYVLTCAAGQHSGYH